VPITRYCGESHLTSPQRLELFVPVCQAVRHAHQKDIIPWQLGEKDKARAFYDRAVEWLDKNQFRSSGASSCSASGPKPRSCWN
jgi:hypothetical protein